MLPLQDESRQRNKYESYRAGGAYSVSEPNYSIQVIASFLLTFTGCGLNFAFGVYQELYETRSGPFHGNVSPAKIDLIGTLAVSLMTIRGPFASAWTRIYSPRTVTLCGGVLFALANIVASFGTRLWLHPDAGLPPRLRDACPTSPPSLWRQAGLTSVAG